MNKIFTYIMKIVDSLYDGRRMYNEYKTKQ